MYVYIYVTLTWDSQTLPNQTKLKKKLNDE